MSNQPPPPPPPGGQPPAQGSESAAPRPKSNRPLYVIIGLLGAAVLALGTVLIITLASDDDDDADTESVAQQEDPDDDTQEDTDQNSGDDDGDESDQDSGDEVEDDAMDKPEDEDEDESEDELDEPGDEEEDSTGTPPPAEQSDAVETDVFDLEVGDCTGSFDTAEGDTVETVDVYPCEAEHQQQVIMLTDIEAEELPDVEAIEQQITEECMPAFEDFVGLPYEESQLYINYLAPSEETWASGDREIVCAVEDPESTVVGSLKGAGR